MSGRLAAFIAARLDEDEAIARAATPGPWAAPARVMDGNVVTSLTYPGGANGYVGGVPVMSDDESRSWADQEHIARHDPGRVLREVEAGRAILAMYEECDGYDLPEGVHDSRDPDEREADAASKATLRDVLEALAAVWSDHPDYEQAWKP